MILDDLLYIVICPASELVECFFVCSVLKRVCVTLADNINTIHRSIPGIDVTAESVLTNPGHGATDAFPFPLFRPSHVLYYFLPFDHL